MQSFDVGADLVSARERTGRPQGAPLLLKAHLENNRIAHTYLFTGPSGAAKEAWTLSFAQALNCDEGDGSRTVPGCGCTSCQKIGRGTHPDVRRYGKDETARSIKIEAMRALVHEANLKPFEGRWKVFILEGAERLTLEAANALLKTLEEPPEHSVFLLWVENKSHLLETIQSRAFEIRVPPEPEKDPRETPAIRTLEEKGGEPFFEELRKVARPELGEILAALLVYVRNLCVEEWKQGGETHRYVEALDAIYETLEALDQNANQKLAVTHLEIHLRRHPEVRRRRTEGSAKDLDPSSSRLRRDSSG